MSTTSVLFVCLGNICRSPMYDSSFCVTRFIHLSLIYSSFNDWVRLPDHQCSFFHFLFTTYRAEAVFRHAVEKRGLSAEFDIDSAGTASYHVSQSASQDSFPSILVLQSDCSLLLALAQEEAGARAWLSWDRTHPRHMFLCALVLADSSARFLAGPSLWSMSYLLMIHPFDLDPSNL